MKSPVHILSRDHHRVAAETSLLKVLYKLHDEGYTAYLAGGAVRDLMLGKTPKDFDVVTDATLHKSGRCSRTAGLLGVVFD